MRIRTYKLFALAFCGMLALFPARDASAEALNGEIKSGGPVAGFSLFLDSYYESLSQGRVSDSVREELTAITGLTREETGYLSVLDIYENLGVADVSGYLNIRETPEETGVIVGKLTAFSGCEILGEENGWLRISSGSVTGYVMGDFIATGIRAKKLAREHASLTVRVDTESLRIRMEPGTDARIWNRGYQGEFFEVEEDLKNGWVKVKLDGDDADSGFTAGYVYVPDNATLMYTLTQAVAFRGGAGGSAVNDGGTEPVRQAIADYAMQFLGNPYVWGGTNPNTGADCSGFTQYVMKQAAGVTMNRTSGEQQKQGVEVDKASMRTGDLVFYGNNQGVINHVALYIGNGQVIHSASKKTGVKISAWNYRTPVSVKNVLGDTVT